jgi:hypothetical protein
MKCIDEVIKKMQAKALGDDGDYMIMLLALADKLCEISKEANAVLYLDKIAQTFCEVLEKQQDIIVGLKAGTNSVNSGAGVQSNDLPGLQTAVGEEKKETEVPFELPEGGVFKNSNQVKEAFIAYLKGIIKNGNPLSHTTVYDYSSRINMLFTYFERERYVGKLEGWLQIEEGMFKENESYLNVYNNLEFFEAYVREKEREIKEREAEKRPFSGEELAFNPLNSYKNLRNSYASLRKFGEFKDKVDEIVKARGEM